jgi:hypothetical protein
MRISLLLIAPSMYALTLLTSSLAKLYQRERNENEMLRFFFPMPFRTLFTLALTIGASSLSTLNRRPNGISIPGNNDNIDEAVLLPHESKFLFALISQQLNLGMEYNTRFLRI